MSLLFGNLTQQFVSFGYTEAQYLQNVNSATALQELQVAAANFRSGAALDASYLVYIGISSPFFPSIYLLILSKVPVPLFARLSTWSFGFTLAK